MEDPKLNKNFARLATDQCATIKGGYIVVAFIKLPNFSRLPFQIQG